MSESWLDELVDTVSFDLNDSFGNVLETVDEGQDLDDVQETFFPIAASVDMVVNTSQHDHIGVDNFCQTACSFGDEIEVETCAGLPAEPTNEHEGQASVGLEVQTRKCYVETENLVDSSMQSCKQFKVSGMTGS